MRRRIPTAASRSVTTGPAITEILLSGIDVDLLRQEYDNIVRLVASLMDGLAPVPILGRCLAAASRTNPPARAVAILGRAYKTIYLLQYLDSPELRRTVRRLLARHESQNALGRKIVSAGHGEFRVGHYEAAAARRPVIPSSRTRCSTRIPAGSRRSCATSARRDTRSRGGGRLAEISPLAFKHQLPGNVRVRPGGADGGRRLVRP